LAVTEKCENPAVKVKQGLKQNIAKLIRVISIPPVMVSALVVILSAAGNNIFTNVWEMGTALMCLAVVPVLAYPLQKLIPGFREKGREGQRNLALILSAAGYLAAWLYGTAAKSNDRLMLIFGTYLLSVVLLLVCNKGLKLRASGHACSVTGPIVFLSYFLGIKASIICILLYGLILWASLELKRHTLKDFVMGTATCIAAFLCNVLLYIIF
jgi:hypothetical protein